MSQKVLEITSEEVKYIDPNQIANIQLVDGTNIIVGEGEQAQEEFVEETKDEQQYQTQEVQGNDGQKLRGRGVLGALAGAAAGAALLGTAAAIGGAVRRPYYGGYGYGYGCGYPMRPIIPPPMVGPPLMRPPMMRGPMMGPRRRF